MLEFCISRSCTLSRISYLLPIGQGARAIQAQCRCKRPAIAVHAATADVQQAQEALQRQQSSWHTGATFVQGVSYIVLILKLSQIGGVRQAKIRPGS